MACTTKNEVIKELRDTVGLAPGKELQAISAILDILAKVEVPSAVLTTLKKGEVFAHVSNVVFDKFAVAGDVLPDGWVFNTLGSHIGSKDTVDEYVKQTGEKNPVVYDVTINDNAKVLQMEDVGDSNWTADNMYDQLKAKFPKMPLTKKSTPEETLVFLRKQGYDAIGYENTEEGGVSYMVLNPSKFELDVTGNTGTVYRSSEVVVDITDAYVSKMGRSMQHFAVSADGTKTKFLGDVAAERVMAYPHKTVVTTTKGLEFTFPRNSSSSNVTTGEKNTRIVRMDFADAIKEITQQPTFGSNKSKVNWKELSKLEENPHGNPERMLKTLDDLHIADGGKETAEHMEQLREVVGNLKPEFFTRMDTYVMEGAEKTGGIVELPKPGRVKGKLGVWMSKVAKKAGNEMGAAEVYAHELVHATTVFALEQAKQGSRDARILARELEYLMESVKERVSWRMFMPENSINKEAEEEIAKEMYQYVFTDENAKAEFISHAMTNPAMMAKLKKMNVAAKRETHTVLEQVMEWFGKLVDLVLGKYEFKDRSNTAYEQVVMLAAKMGELNNEALQHVEENKALSVKFAEMLDAGNMAVHDALQKVMEKMTKDNGLPIEPAPSDKAAKVVWMVKYFGKVIKNDIYRNYFGRVLSAWYVKPEGVIRDWARAFMETSDLQKSAEWLGTGADNIDRVRNTAIVAAKKYALEGFKETPTAAEERAMTRALLDTDLQELHTNGGYSTLDIRDILEDREELNRRLSRAKHTLKTIDPKFYNWNVNQAHGLGVYMATHQAHAAQNLNTENIAFGIMSTTRRKMTGKEELIKVLDEVATLTALVHTSEADKKLAAEMIRAEKVGVERLLAMHKGFVKDSLDKLFKTDKAHMIKGYTKETFDDKITMEIAPVSSRKELEARGFTLVSELTKSKNDSSTAMAIYTSDAYAVSDRLRGATQLASFGTKGTTLSKVHWIEGDEFAKERIELDKLKMDKTRAELVKAMEKGELNWGTIEKGIAPLIDQYGNVVDYRYTMSKSLKEDLLGQVTTASDVLAKSYGNVLNKQMAVAHNEKVLDLILTDMRDNWEPGTTSGKGAAMGMEYILIGPQSGGEAHEIYKVLPDIFKDAIDKNPHRVMAVPRHLMHIYFGYRHMSIVDFPGLAKVTPAMVRNIIKIVETMWIEAVKLVKANVLLKMPFVLVGNIISNFMFAVLTGSNPADLIRDYVDSFRDIRKYIRADRRISALKVKVSAKTATVKEREELKMLEQDVKDSPIHELFELGLYQAVVEDVENMNLQSSNKWKEIADERLKNVPSLIRTPLQWAYLSSETKWYKVNQEVLQMSDLIARDVQNRKMKRVENDQIAGRRKLPKWWTDEHGTAKLSTASTKAFLEAAKKQRHWSLLENFVNYNKPTSRLEDYLNRIGAILFTKFTKGIQRVIATSTYTNPINALLMMLGQAYLVDVEMIQDQALFTRSWGNIGYNPLDHVMSLVTPALIKDSTYTFVQ